MSEKEYLNVLVIGAHPDDCELFAGGTAAKFAARGDKVKFVSVTNGDVGHHQESGDALAKRRKEETIKAAQVLGIEYDILPFHDGKLTPSLETREQIIRSIREWKANLVFTHRPNDYHPDHRYTSLLVQDAAYMVMVPNVCPDTPPLMTNPMFFYMWDGFKKPYPFQVDIAVAIDDVTTQKFDMIECHQSQFFEWLPHTFGQLNEVPQSPEDRRKWLEDTWGAWLLQMRDCAAEKLCQRYGVIETASIKYAEPFEICEYGTKPSAEDLYRLFPR